MPCIQVYNKIDKAPVASARPLNGSGSAKFWVSAKSREGLIELTEAIRDRCLGPPITGILKLGPDQSRLRARLFDLRAVRGERVHELGGWFLDVELTANRWKELCIEEGLSDDSFQREIRVL